MDIGHCEKTKEALGNPLLLGIAVGLGVLLVALGLHVLETKVILLFLSSSVFLAGNLRVDFGGAEILHVGVRHGVLQGDGELKLTGNGLVEAVEEAFPCLLVGRSHAITSSGLIDTREDSSLQLVADFN